MAPDSQAHVSGEPDEARDTADHGDDVQRRFRYQHGYGVMLLVAATSGRLPYASLWCEHHEDYLASRAGGLFDAYQVKTRETRLGPWSLSDRAFARALCRFVTLDARFPGRIAAFKFVSNNDYLTATGATRVNSPVYLLRAVRDSTVTDTLCATMMDSLATQCTCSAAQLRSVLLRTELILGPSMDTIDTVIAHEHLPLLDSCARMTPDQLNNVRDELLEAVHRASALTTSDPARHWYCITRSDQRDPYLVSKQLTIEQARDIISRALTVPFRYTPSGTPDILKRPEDLSLLEKKLLIGGIGTHADIMKRRARSAERHLLEITAADPDQAELLLAQVTGIVQGACSDAYAIACLDAEPFGPQMLRDVVQRLRLVADSTPALVSHQGPDCLMGVAALLTDECKVWWSQPPRTSEAE